MSYYASTYETDVRILAKDVPRLIDIYNAMYNESGVAATTIDDVFRNTGFTPDPIIHYNRAARSPERSGDYSFFYEYNPWRSDEADEFLEMIAPFVERGSHIAFIGEDNCMWAYYFDGTEVEEYEGETYFPGMPGEVSYRGLSERESAMTNLETIFGKELAHNLPQDFVDRINAAKPGTILQSIAEALFDAITCRPVRVNPIPTSALGQALGNVLVDEFVGGGAA